MKKILIVEDEAIVAMENKMNLTKAGFLVVGSVSSAEDALLKIAETLPDLILMDIKLKGDLNGIDAVSIIREKNNIPVVFGNMFLDVFMKYILYFGISYAIATLTYNFIELPFLNFRDKYFR